MGYEGISLDIYKLLYRLELTPSYKGFYQIAYAVQMILEDSQKLLGVTKQLYPEIAKRCETTSAAVERNIRTAVKVIWRKSAWRLEQMALCPLTSRPSASQLLSILVSEIEKDRGVS